MVKTVKFLKNYSKIVTPYYIDLIPLKDENGDSKYLRNNNKIKERISLRKSSKDLNCTECGSLIAKNENYVRDKFWWENGYDNFIVKTTNFVCLSCWKGEVPARISNNWIKNGKRRI